MPIVYIGTYTAKGGSEGIYCYEADAATGALTKLGSYLADNPSYVTLSPDKCKLYACLEVGEYKGGHGGGLMTLAVDGKGGFTHLGEAPTHGSAPCHLLATENFLYCANYGEGTVNQVTLKDGVTADVKTFVHSGSGPDARRQKGPHAHFVGFTPDKKYLTAVDLGLDAVLLYPFDAENGISEPAARVPSPVPGAGPRHLVFSKGGDMCFVVFEMGSLVASYKYSGGAFEHVCTRSTLPEGFDAFSSCAAIRMSPDGRFVYCSNRGHDSIAVFEIIADGALNLVQIAPTGGKTPRDFAFLPGGAWILAAHQDGGGVTRLPVDVSSGMLGAPEVAADIPMPVCVLA